MSLLVLQASSAALHTSHKMSVEIQDFVEAVQFCTDRCNGDELKRLLSLRHNATLSNSAAVSVALKVCFATRPKQFPRCHRFNLQRSKRLFSKLPGRFGIICLNLFGCAASMLELKWDEAFKTHQQFLEYVLANLAPS